MVELARIGKDQCVTNPKLFSDTKFVRYQIRKLDHFCSFLRLIGFFATYVTFDFIKGVHPDQNEMQL